VKNLRKMGGGVFVMGDRGTRSSKLTAITPRMSENDAPVVLKKPFVENKKELGS